MKTTKHLIRTAITMTIVVLLSTACMKDFLDLKRDKSQVIPVTLEDYRSIFENDQMNTGYPILGEIGSDDYYISAQEWNGLSNPVQKNGYIWASEIFEGLAGSDWNYAFERILYANFVLEGVSSIGETPANKATRDELIGAAHFFRGTNYFLLTQLFCKQYDATTASEDLGLPLRTTSNINVQFQRATLAATYSQIIDDLEIAARLLPSVMSLNTRPYRAAALGMLANVYLQMGEYTMAGNYVDDALQLAPEILDYNEVDTALPLPFPLYGQGNPEIIFCSTAINVGILANSRLTIDDELYDSYHEHDLRKQAFFFINGDRNTFKGNYTGNTANYFTGVTTPELLIIRSECNARLGNVEASIADINRLLENRFRHEDFEPIDNNFPQNEVIQLVLSERRKELIYRGRRWHDLKRFSKDPSLAKSLTRTLDGTEYTLPINSPRWVWPIPPDVVNLGGLIQNER